MASQSPPKNFGVALFPGFDPFHFLDTLIILTSLDKTHPVQIAFLSPTAAPVPPQPASWSHTHPPTGPVAPTHTFNLAPDDLEVLLVPGGMGAMDTEKSQPAVDFIRARYPKLRCLLTVCTGSFLAARAGILEGREATTGDIFYPYVSDKETGVKWKRKGRCLDGNIWTSSRAPAAVDQIFAFIADQFGEEIAKDVEKESGYTWNRESAFNDAYAELVSDMEADLL